MRIKKISISGQFDCEEYDEKYKYIYMYFFSYLPTLRNHTVHLYLFFNSCFHLPCRTDGALSSLTAMANFQQDLKFVN